MRGVARRCGGSDKYVGEPDYSDTDLRFHIGAWIAPPQAIEETGYINYATEENYRLIAESGATTAYSLYATDQESAVIDLALAEKVGIDYYVRDDTIWQLLDMTDEEIAETDLFDAYKDSPRSRATWSSTNRARINSMTLQPSNRNMKRCSPAKISM